MIDVRLIDADELLKIIPPEETCSRFAVANAPTVVLHEPQRWIPCSETPDTDRNVFVARGEHEFMSVCIGHYDHDNNQWYEDRNWFAKCLYDGLYWCEIPPLPEPYKWDET